MNHKDKLSSLENAMYKRITKETLMEISATMTKAAMDEKMAKRDYRLLLSLLTSLNYDDFSTISQQNLCKTLSMHKSDVSLAISALVNLGYIQRINSTKVYRLKKSLI